MGITIFEPELDPSDPHGSMYWTLLEIEVKVRSSLVAVVHNL